jgi:hypothetical protein
MKRYSVRRLLLGCLGVHVSCIMIGFLLMRPTNTKISALTDTLDCEWPIRKFQCKNDTTNATQRQHYLPTVTFVISHCNHRLDWVMEFIKEVNWMKHIVIYSKCGQEIIGLSAINNANATIIDDVPVEVWRIENLGRNDHTFLFHILRRLRYERNEMNNLTDGDRDDEYIVFLKDNRETANALGARWRSLADMMTIQKFHNFACGLDFRFFNKLYVSQYHYQLYLHKFNLTEHEVHEDRYANISSHPSRITFKSEFQSLKDWFRILRIQFPQAFIPVCYGGSFMTSMSTIRKVKVSIWEKMLRLLSRGDNIEEGHYMERTWAAILSQPISSCVVEKIIESTRALVRNGPKIGGLLIELDPKVVGQYIVF